MRFKEIMNRAMCAAGPRVVVGVSVLGLLVLGGCGVGGGGSGGGGGTGGGGGATGGTALAAGGAKDIYVMEYTSSGAVQSILDFAADTSGSLSPKATLLPPAGVQVDSLATDSAGQLYLGADSVDANGNLVNQVFVYAAGASGQATPLRTINLTSEPNESFLPFYMTVDSSGKLYVVGLGVVGTFPANASGNTAAIRIFSFGQADGGGTESGPTGIAVDDSGNIYLGSYLPDVMATSEVGNIFIYAAGASGNATPQRTIQTQGIPYGLALDASGNIYSAVDNTTLNSSGQVTASTCAVVEYGGLTASSPIVKTIAGAATGLTFGTGPQIDEAGNLYLANDAASGTGSNGSSRLEIVGFAPTATGDVAPGVMFSSSSWTETGSQIAVH